MITIDGSFGEGGGQVLRTSLALSAITGQPLHLYNIRAARPKPGLQAQHLTSVRAAAAICDARLEGASLGSMSLMFEPTHPPQAGEYVFDVTEARRGGSAGATTLVLQTVLLPLALAPRRRVACDDSRRDACAVQPAVSVHPACLPAHALADGCFALRSSCSDTAGIRPAAARLQVRIQARPGALAPITLTERGELRKLWGIAAVSNLPSHIAQRMAKPRGQRVEGSGYPEPH